MAENTDNLIVSCVTVLRQTGCKRGQRQLDTGYVKVDKDNLIRVMSCVTVYR